MINASIELQVRHLERTLLILKIATVVLILGLGATAFTLWVQSAARGERIAAYRADRADMGGDLAALKSDVTTYAAATNLLAEQVKRRGGRPVVNPDDLPDTPALLPRLPGPPGVQGERGQRGARGSRGATGRTTAGSDGTDGRDGGDSTTPGPAGPAGPDSTVPGPQGQAGQAGPSGQPGTDGKDGTNGTARPGTYTCSDPDNQYVAGFTVGDGGDVTLDCRMSAPPPTAP